MARFRKAEPPFAGSSRCRLSAADAVVWGLPTDCGAGTGRLGARKGPRAIRAASRIWNTVRTSSGFPFPEHGRLLDLGDVDFSGARGAEVYRRIAAAAPPLLPGRLNVAIGGDHSVTVPILEAAGGCWGLVYLDAHPDCIVAYHGNRDSHACTLKRLVESGRADPRRTAVLGLRAPEAEEVAWLQAQGIKTITAWQVAELGIERACRRAFAVAGGGPVYLSLDLDALDAGCVPGVENPEPGGLSAREALWACDFFGRRVAACDLVEVSGERDPAGLTAKTAARMLLDLIGAFIQEKGRR